MKKAAVFSLLMLASLTGGRTQDLQQIINENEVSRIEHVLADDSMEGRRIFTPGIEKASRFIEAEFRKTGLDTLEGNHGYRQDFSRSSTRYDLVSLRINGEPMENTAVMVLSAQDTLHWTQKSALKSVVIGPDEDPVAQMRQYLDPGENTIVWVNTKFAPLFLRLKDLPGQKNGDKTRPGSVVFVLYDKNPGAFSLRVNRNETLKKANNVVGILPGRSRPQEYVIFSAHYDHLGIGKPEAGDSIYNGANDDASGTTAVMLLAKYFKAQNKNERTLLFVAFTGEEEGGYGSRYFSTQIDPEKVVALFNIEMIGTASKWGKNSAYSTGYDKTDFGQILQRRLAGTGYTFHPDPYPDQNLFYRSDNATLARQGVPAHTISTAKMDDEPNYHRPGDEVSTLDMSNMAAVIRAVALSASGIISGEDTPTRVTGDQLIK